MLTDNLERGHHLFLLSFDLLQLLLIFMECFAAELLGMAYMDFLLYNFTRYGC